MVETIKEQRAKARERTRKYRDRLKGKGVPTSRTVDQALLHAVLYLLATGKLGLTQEAFRKIINGASLILRRKHNRNASEAMIAERVKFHAKGGWIKAAQDAEDYPPDPAAVEWLAKQGHLERHGV